MGERVVAGRRQRYLRARQRTGGVVGGRGTDRSCKQGKAGWNRAEVYDFAAAMQAEPVRRNGGAFLVIRFSLAMTSSGHLQYTLASIDAPRNKSRRPDASLGWTALYDDSRGSWRRRHQGRAAVGRRRNANLGSAFRRPGPRRLLPGHKPQQARNRRRFHAVGRSCAP